MAKNGKFVKRKVPATTTNKQKAIVNFLLSEGHSASRINTTGIYKKDIDAWITGGGRNGFTDVCGTFKSRYIFPMGSDMEKKYIGISFYIEGKFTDGDSLGEDQIYFREEVIAAGALYLAPESLEEFYEWYQDIKIKHL